jgi:N-acetylglucosamine-6-phosphate deacetylase
LPTYIAQRIVTGGGGITPSPAWVVVEDEIIVATGTGTPTTGRDDVIDRTDALLAPGFIDIQVNGAGTVDFATASETEIVDAIRDLNAGGCTACFPTLVSAPLDAYPAMLDRLARVREKEPSVLGVHLEGPFLGNAPGAHPPELLRTVDLDWLLALVDRYGALVRIVTLAPEADPDLAATRALHERGIAVALGHSTATYDEARAAADAGATLVTHLFNGMSAFHHREPGLPGAALTDKRLTPSFIADFVHVHPAAISIALASRPDAVLVTDRVGGDLHIDGGAARLPDGTLAGSCVTMLESIRNLVRAGIPLGQAVRTGTANPAGVLGLTDRGRIAPGCRADLVWLDPVTLEPAPREPRGGRGGS